MSKIISQEKKGFIIIVLLLLLLLLLLSIIIFISSWFNKYKNQPPSRYNHSYHTTIHTKVILHISSSALQTIAWICQISKNAIQLKLGHKQISSWEIYITKKSKWHTIHVQQTFPKFFSFNLNLFKVLFLAQEGRLFQRSAQN